MFKDIKGFEGKYQINEKGDVKSLSRRKGAIVCKERILKKDINNAGYERVTLCKDDKCKKYLLHRLVYENFISPIPEGMTIHHIDEDKVNNHINNLLVCTSRQNNHFSGEAKGYKLTQSDVDFIKHSNLTTREISDRFNISLRHALRVKKNERWIS